MNITRSTVRWSEHDSLVLRVCGGEIHRAFNRSTDTPMPKIQMMSREERAQFLGVSMEAYDEIRAAAMKLGQPARSKGRARARATKKPQLRGTVRDAVSILGKEARTVRALAAKGKIPGAAKIGGTYTFNLELLDTYVSSKEQELCQSARRRQVVSGGTGYSTVGYKPAAKTSNGHYAQTIQRLREVAARPSATER
jgi:hypothetical protein